MSPAAAVHLRSSSHSSPIQNPNLIPDATSHSSFDHSAFTCANFSDNGEGLNPSAFDNASGRGFATAFAAHQGLSATGSAASRSRPRLMKLRKQSASQHARSRSRTAASEVSSGFNPFRSEGGGSDQVNSYVNTSNGFMESSTEAENLNTACNGGSLNSQPKFENTGFVFGAKRSEVATNSNSQHGATEESGSSINRGKITIEKETEIRKSDHVEFIFTAKRSDVESKSCDERQKNSENSGKRVSDDERKVGLDSELEQREFDGTGFVFCAHQNYLDSDLNTVKGVHNKCEENSGLGNGEERKCKTEAEYVKKDTPGFIFGDHQIGKTSNFYVEKQESHDTPRNSNHYVGTSIPNTETISNSTLHSDQDCQLNNDNKCESGSGCTSSISTACSPFPDCKLTDEMKKLNINNSQKVSGADITRNLKDSCGNGSAAFVFRGSDNATDSFNLNSGTKSDAPQSCPDVALENKHGQYFETCKRNDIQDKCDSGFTNIHEGSKESFMGFRPPSWDPSCFKENLFPASNKEKDSSEKARSSKERGSKQVRTKLKRHSLNKKQTRKDHLSQGSGSLETPDSSGNYSPMDFSPYQETRADQDVKSPTELNEPSIADHDYVFSTLYSNIPTDYKDEHLAAGGSKDDINTNDCKCEDPNEYNFKSSHGNSYGPSTACPSFNISSSNVAGAWPDAGSGFSLNNDQKKTHQFCVAPGVEDSTENNFTFSASSTVEGTVPPSFKRKQKKYRSKVASDSFIISSNPNEKLGSSVQISPSSYSDVMMGRSEMNNQLDEGKFASPATIQEACDEWRFRCSS